MLQNALDNDDDFKKIHTVSQQMGKATTFEDYKALVHSAADAYDKNSKATTHATRNAYSHGLDIYDPVEYLYDGHDLNTNIDTIYANAAHTHGGMMSASNHFCQISVPLPKDCKLILEQDLCSTSTLAHSFCSMHGWGGNC